MKNARTKDSKVRTADDKKKKMLALGLKRQKSVGRKVPFTAKYYS